ncbi:MAG: inositol monophosphatase family protein [Planctomycetota bacterium]|jgi:histidinol phosphatase-like enzyme (inositol monophosphatase family)|nr:inositol monophosphatase family protein [Planctomycetota bacterium]
MTDLQKRMELALEAARKAGELTLEYFQKGIEVEFKADQSPVTEADRNSEALLIELLSNEFPKDAFLGEESGERPGSSGYRWVLDPIDGTRSFVQGVPLYGVLVGLEDPAGEAILGVVNMPGLDETLVAAVGEGCYHNGSRTDGSRANVSTVSELSSACVTYTGFETFRQSDSLGVHSLLGDQVKVLRSWGDCYGHLLVATGRAEVMLDPVLSRWDIVPLKPIVEEAGGVFTDWQGRGGSGGSSGISTNSALAEEVRSIICAAGGENTDSPN